MKRRPLTHVKVEVGRRWSTVGEARVTEPAPPVAHRHDAFGRLVVTASTDSGLTLRWYDVADRLVRMQDALLNVATYAYDSAGRIVKQSARAREGEPTLTTWTYEGRRLVALDHPTQSERYGYNAHGWRSSKTVVMQRYRQWLEQNYSLTLQ